MSLLEERLEGRLDEKMEKLDGLRPLPSSAVAKLREKFEIEMTYNSNAIEGNSLTQKETFLVINEGIAVRGKPLRDHLEAKDHFAAIEYVRDLVDESRKQPVTENLIRRLHQLVVSDTDKEWAGTGCRPGRSRAQSIGRED